MVALLLPLLLASQILSSAALPLSNTDSQLTLAEPPQTNIITTQMRPSERPRTANRPSLRIVRVDFSKIHYNQDDTESSLLKFITGGQSATTTKSFLRQEAWVCAEESETMWCRIKSAASYEIPMDSYLASVVVCRAIAVLIFSSSLMIAVVAMLWSRISPRQNRIVLTDEFIAEKPYKTADTQRIPSAVQEIKK